MLGVGNVWGQTSKTATINFGSGSGDVKIDQSPVNGEDSQKNKWTITSTFSGDASYTQNADYSQIGSSNKAVKTVTFTTTLPAGSTITDFGAKFGGSGSGASGSAALSIGDNTVTLSSNSWSGSNTTTITKSGLSLQGAIAVTINNSAKGVKCYYIEVKYTVGSSKTATTTTFGAGVDNQTFDAEVGGTFETKTATVSASGTSVTEPAVTYASSKPAVAKVDENTGAVTIVAKGTTDITASYAGNDTYDASSAKYTIDVTNPNEVSVWSEKWNNGTTGYTLVSGGSTTQLYDANLAGGEKPEMLVGKTSGSVTTPSISLAGSTSPYTLTYKANNANLAVSSSTTGVSVGEISLVSGTTYSCAVTIPQNCASIVLTFSNSASGNTRLDDMELIGTNAATISTTPTISPADGSVFSSATQEISITAAQGASIYYTTDGTTPDNKKTPYTSAFTISETKTIKAIAYETGKQPSSVASATITKIDLFDINCSAPVGGTYTVKVGDADAQTITEATVIQGGEGKTITMTIAASAGYKPQATPFVVKDADEATVSVSKDGNNYSFTMPSKAVTITAKYSAVYTIGKSVAGNGSITIKDKAGNVITETSSGSKVVVDVNPETGYQLTELYYIKQGESDHIEITATENVYSFTMVAQNVTVYATFSAKVLNITYKDQNNADFSGVHGDNYPTTHTYGTETSLVSPTKDHYAFKGWFGNSGCTGDAVTSIPGDAYTVDFTLYAKWTINTHSITFTNVYDGGTVKVNGETSSPVNVDYNSEVTIATTDNAHYTLATLTYQVGENDPVDIKSSKTFNMPDADVTIAATWTQDPTYKITFYNNGSTEGLTPTTGLYSGDAYGTLPVLESSAACHPTYKAFIGWTTNPISGSQASAPTLAKSTDQIGNADVNLYAVWAQANEPTQTTYNKVTDLSTLVAGDKVVFVGANSSNVTYAMKAYDGSSNNVSSVSVTITDNAISNIGQACAYTLGGSTGSWTLFDGTYYLYAAAKSSNHLKGQTSVDVNAQWSFTMETTGVSVVSNTTENRGQMLFNHNTESSPIFACYANTSTNKTKYFDIYRKPGTTYSNYYTNCSADPTYTITITQPTGGSIGASQTTAYASTAITLSNNATAGYSFQKYVLTKKLDGSDVTSTYISGNTLTMPAFDVNLTATFPAKEVESISLSKAATTLEKDASEVLPTVNYLPADLIDAKKGVNWSTSAEAVAKVENGNIVAVGKGQATITATSTSDDTKMASITVNVYEWVSTGYKMSKEGATEYTNAQTYSASAWEVSEGFKRSDDESQTKDVVVPAANVTVTFGGAAITDGYQFKIADNGKKLVFMVGETTVKEYTITVTAVPEDTFTDNIFSIEKPSQTGTYNLPSIDNQTKGEEATCQDHNIFMGWVIEANKNTPTDDNILKAGTEVTAANTKYFAVWAYDNTQEKDVTASITSFNSTSGTLNKVNWSAGNKDAQNGPNGNNNDNELRLYGANTNKTYGNYISFSTQSGFKIKEINLTTSKGGGYAYAQSSYMSTMSFTGEGSRGEQTNIVFNNLDCSGFTIITKGVGKDHNLTVTAMSVTYRGTIVEYTDYLVVCAERHEASYDANGGTGSYDATNYAEGVTFNLPDGAALTYTDHKFAGWKANNTGDLLAGGAEYTMGENDVKFYAQWNACTAQSLNVNSTGATLYFKEGETFSSKGLVVTAHRDYCDDDVTVNDWTTNYDGYVFQHTDGGDKTVTVSSESLQAQGTYTIHVTQQCQLVYNVAGEQFAVKAAMTGDKIVFPDEVPADLTASIKFLGWSTKEYTATSFTEEPEFVDINTTITEAENVYNAVFGNVRATEDATVVIKKSSLLSTGTSYSWLSWKQDEIGGQMYAATDNDDQIKFKYESGFGSAVFNAVYVPGDIKSISMKRNDSSSDRNWNAWALNTAASTTSLPTSDGLGVKVFKAGETITWNVKNGSYRYFVLQQQQGGGSGNAVSDITITYEKPTEISKYYMSLSFDYTRLAADFSKGTITTICLPKAVEEGEFAGCTIYEVAGLEKRDGDPYKIFYDQVFSMEAGVPYVIELNEGAEKAQFHYTGDATTAKTVNGLVGTFDGVAKAEYNDLNGNYIVYQNAIRKCGTNCSLGANKAYIVMGDVPDIDLAPAPAPGRRRIAMGTNGTEEVDTPTNLLNTATDADQVRKLVIDNQLIIIRGGKMYNAAGALVK